VREWKGENVEQKMQRKTEEGERGNRNGELDRQRKKIHNIL
jgi:hypothetical protein